MAENWRKRRQCPKCGKSVGLTKSGTLWSHQFAAEYCSGSGWKPEPRSVYERWQASTKQTTEVDDAP